MRNFNIVTGAPYCDSFNPEEQWLIASVPGARRCIIRHNLFINFHGSSMMSGIIRGKALTAQKDNFSKWIEWARGKILEFPEPKPSAIEVEVEETEEEEPKEKDDTVPAFESDEPIEEEVKAEEY